MSAPATPTEASAAAWPRLGVLAIRTFVLATAGLLLALVVAGAALGLDPVVVMSGSMAPRIQPGDVVLLAPPDPEGIGPGAVVTYTDPAAPDRLVTHRVVERLDDGQVRTRGDANPTADSTPVPIDQVVGQGRWLVPAVGAPLAWLRAGQVVPALGVLGVLAVLLVLRPVPARAPTEGDAPSRWRRRLPLVTGTGACVLVVVGMVATPAHAFTSTTTSSANAWQASLVPAPSPVEAVGTCTTQGRPAPVVDLAWASSGADAYVVRRADGSGAFVDVATLDGATTGWQDVDVVVATTYQYVVEAVVGPWTSRTGVPVEVLTPTACSRGGGGGGPGGGGGGPGGGPPGA